MPKVRKTKNCLAIPAALAVAVLSAQSGSAEGWERPETGSGSPAAVISTDIGSRSFQLAYGREIGEMVFSGEVVRANSGGLTRAMDADETRHLRLLAGYDFGPATGLVSLGRLQARSSSGKRDGLLLGLGMRVSVNRALQLTGDLLHHEAEPVHDGSRQRGETLSVSPAFRF